MGKLFCILSIIILLAGCDNGNNDRLRAFYKEGRSFLMKGDAPSALECFQRAVDEADTTSVDCDYIALAGVYGAMAQIYSEQELTEDYLTATRRASRCSWLGKDSVSALSYDMSEAQAYYAMRLYDEALSLAKRVRNRFREYGHADYAEFCNGSIGVMHLACGEYEEAKACLDSYYECRTMSGNPLQTEGNEASYWIFMALYYEGVGKADSAIVCFKHALADESRTEKTLIDGYGGLVMLYKARQERDSAYKYQTLYVDVLNDYTDKLKQDKVMRMSSLYNYFAHKRNADEASASALGYRLVAIMLVVLVVVVVVVLIVIRMRLQRRMRRISNEKIVAEATLNLINIGKGRQELRETAIYQRLTAYIKNPARNDDISAEEWGEFQHVMEDIHPTLHAYLNREVALSDKEYRVCLLTKAGFKPRDITLLLSLSSGEVSHLKIRLLRKVFGEEGKTSDFNAKIAEV